jgi:hypothetical protein
MGWSSRGLALRPFYSMICPAGTGGRKDLGGGRPAFPSIALCSHPSTPLRAAFGGGLRPALTDAARSALCALQAGAEKRRSAEQRNAP